MARAKKTAPASPPAMMCSACSGWVIRPAAVGKFASVRMAVAKVSGSSLLVAFPHARISRH